MAAHLAAAVSLGVLSDIGLHLGDQATFLFALASPWVLLAFSAGRASAPSWSAFAGAGTLLAGLAAYYLWMLIGPGVALAVLTGSGYKGMTWVAVGTAVGAVAGGIGALTKHRRLFLAEAAWCGAAAAPSVDAILLAAYGDAPRTAVAIVVGGAALALAWAMSHGARKRILALGLPLATLVLWQMELVILQQAFGRMTWI